jgi:hypothetical protein
LGKGIKKFKQLLIMPDKYIIYREDSKNNGSAKWANLLNSLSSAQEKDFLRLVNMNKFDDGSETSQYQAVNALLAHYRKRDGQLSAETCCPSLKNKPLRQRRSPN